ncbi:MAG: erythromycin biosynthesis sensory transduction protein eryC1 [Pseudomonadales bacterium]|nr:erythromycin biosynthesis sensory transduction protein eryC1 [Pseudomonadales bacterium]
MIIGSDPKAQYLALKQEIDQAIGNVLASGRYVLGDETNEFEREFADYIGTGHCIGVGNGTDALELALRACGVGQGDEVITVSHTAVATVAAIVQSGATPVLIDVDPNSYTMSIDQLEPALSENTKAIIPVHLYGHPAHMPALMKLVEGTDIRVIEDCAQAHGAAIEGKKVGNFGDIACFSFYPTKNLSAIGDGGAVTTSDSALAKQLRLLREYGWEERFHSSQLGRNSRLDEIQAAILRVKLRHLDEFNLARKNIAKIYNEKLSELGLGLPNCEASYEHVYHQYVIRSQKRDALLKSLGEAKILAGIHYPLPVHRQAAYAEMAIMSGDLSTTDTLCDEILSLPIYPELGQQVHDVVAGVKAFHH